MRPFSSSFAAVDWARKVLADKSTVFLDTETTGLGPDAEICDIAVVDASGLVLFESLVATISPIPAEASAIHHIFDEDLVGQPEWAEVMAAVCPLLADRQVIVYNASFDLTMMGQCSRRIGSSFPPGEWHCAMLAYAAFRATAVGPRGHRWHKLDDAVLSFGGSPGGHRAAKDALACLAVVKGIAAATWIPTRLWNE
ncbi:MAG: 3'-5' exonuclease [Chloroflexota bacterium]|nr:3'-5' exonuclease [Chloroflexota bacterium]